MSGGRPVLLIVAKAPIPGLVKTRLTPPFTPHQAAALAAAALLDTLDACRAAAVLAGLTWSFCPSGDPGRAVSGSAIRSALARVRVLPQRAGKGWPRGSRPHILTLPGTSGQRCRSAWTPHS